MMDWKTNFVLMMQVGKNNGSDQQKMRFQFHLITILIMNQAIHYPNHRQHLLKNPHYQLNTLVIMKKHPLKKNHPRPWTSKKDVLDTIKKLYFMCGGDDNIEHLYILPLRWLYILQFEDFSEEIYENFKNTSCTPIKILLRKISTVGIPKPTVVVIIFRVFIWLLSIKNAAKKTISICRVSKF